MMLAFDPRSNSLNFIRLVLASAVVISHSITLGGFGSEDVAHKTTLGTFAVYGFFGISGFLVCASSEDNTVTRYMWKRAVRILPAFWMCLIVTAAVFGTVAWLHGAAEPLRNCGLACYLHEPAGPLGFIYRNLGLRIQQVGISKTLQGVPLKGIWNGSLWTLWYEAICYGLLAALAVAGALRHRIWLLTAATLTWLLEIPFTSVPSINAQVNFLHHATVAKIIVLVPLFLTGAVIYKFRAEIPDSGWLAMASTAVFLAGFVIPIGNSVPAYTLTSTDVAAMFAVYPLLWLGCHLPLQKAGARNDYSYGIYIYAFPVQQLLAVFGVAHWGFVGYTGMTFLVLIPMAAASWWVIERNALKLKSLGRW